jgi:HPt (histidine-containing phosphotransfer) domain-containing protein
MESRILQVNRQLRAWGLNGLTAALLESAGPLAWLGAQALYFSAPVLSLVAPSAQLDDLARLLEEPQALQRLVNALSEEPRA